MLKSRYFIAIFMLVLAGWAFACGPKKLSGPPQELLTEIASVEADFGALSALAPTAEDTAKYNAAIGAAKNAQAQSNYSLAMQNARVARLEVERLGGALNFRELEKYNPDQTLTYHYRQQMKLSEEAQAAGKIDEAISAAAEARKQATLALQLSRDCLSSVQQRLATLKDQLEQLYMPEFDTVKLYWQAVNSLPKQKCEDTRKVVDKLEYMIKRFRDNTVSTPSSETFTVSAPPEFVRIYGDPIIFQEVTPEGLKTRLARVSVGTKVKFIRANYAAPGKTYYLVEDPNTAAKGWMAEERVWPERAALMKNIK